MKESHIIMILVVFAWPLNYLYQQQLGAITFLLLAIFFLVISIKEMKKVSEPRKKERDKSLQQKIKENNDKN